MGQTVDDEHVRQLGAQAMIELFLLGFFTVAKVLGFLHGIGREERSIITALAHGERNKALFSQFELAAVRNQDFRWHLGLQIPHGFVHMHRQILDCATTLRTDDVRAPAVLREGIAQTGCKRECSVAPQVIFVADTDIFRVVEALGRIFLRVIGLTQQETRHGKTDVLGIIGFAEAAPFRKLGSFENGTQFLEIRQAVKRIQAKEFRTCRCNERRMGYRCHRRRVLQRLHVDRVRAKFVVGDDGTHRLTTKLTVFCCIRQFVQTGLGDVRCIFEIIIQILLGRVDDFDLDVLAKVSAIHQGLQASPGGFQLLECRRMQNVIHLLAELEIQLIDHAIDQVLVDAFFGIFRAQQFGNKCADTTLRHFIAFITAIHAGLGYNLVKQRAFLNFQRALAHLYHAFGISHDTLLSR